MRRANQVTAKAQPTPAVNKNGVKKPDSKSQNRYKKVKRLNERITGMNVEIFEFARL
jgi:hypothetical protein